MFLTVKPKAQYGQLDNVVIFFMFTFHFWSLFTFKLRNKDLFVHCRTQILPILKIYHLNFPVALSHSRAFL